MKQTFFGKREKDNERDETSSEQDSLGTNSLGIYGDRIAVYSRHPTGEVTLAKCCHTP